MNYWKLFLRKVAYTIMPTSMIRLYSKIFFKKDLFATKLRISNEVFDQIYEKNFWGDAESFSGGGSTLDATKFLRKRLECLIVEKNIKTMLDIPCGDFNWMSRVEKDNVQYIGADIVKSLIAKNTECYTSDNVCFIVRDLTKDKLPRVDLILCKDCLQHLSYINVKKAINNIRKSGSKYLLVTTYPKTWMNWDILDGDYRPLNLRKSPFNFPKPELEILERSKAEGVEVDKTMYLYKVNDLPLYPDL